MKRIKELKTGNNFFMDVETPLNIIGKNNYIELTTRFDSSFNRYFVF